MTEHTIQNTVEGPTVKRLERSRSDRMLAGVCGGLADYFEIHPAFYRVGFVVLTLLGGAGIVIYAAAALVMPDAGKEESIATEALRGRRDRPWPLIGLGLLAIGGAVLLSHATLWPHGDAWIGLLIVGGAILWLTRKGRAAEGAPTAELAREDSHRIRRFFGAVALTFGALVALLFVALAVFAAVVHLHVGRGVGDRTYEVAGYQDLRQGYKLGIGDLRVDMSNVRFPAKETRVVARVDVGSLTVTVPRDVALQVHGDAQFGNVDLLGNTADGHNAERTVDQTGKRVLVLDAHVGAGNLRDERAVR
jgi:phage shock protein PspC (stress-responsive transcriptional regulator)